MDRQTLDQLNNTLINPNGPDGKISAENHREYNNALADYAEDVADEAKTDMLYGIKGVATQTNAPTPYTAGTYPDGLIETYRVVEPLNNASAWYTLADATNKAKFPITQDMLNANDILLTSTNGVISVFLNAKLKGDSAYQVAVANGFVGTEAQWLAQYDSLQLKKQVHSSNGVVVAARNGITYDRVTGKLDSTVLQTYYNADGQRFFVTSSEGAGTQRIKDFYVTDAADAVGTVRVIYADIDPAVGGNITLQSAKWGTLPTLALGKERIVFGYSNKVTVSTVVTIDFKSELLQIFAESSVWKTPVQNAIEQAAQATADIPTIKAVLKAEIHTSEGFVKNDKTAYSYDRTTGMFSNSALWNYYNANGIRYFITNPEGAAAFRITNFAVGSEADPIDAVRLIYADISVPVAGSALTLLAARETAMPAVPNGKDRVIFGYSLKVAANSYDLCLPMFGIYHQTTVYRTPIQIALEGVFPLKGWEWLAFGDSILEQASSYAEQAIPLVQMTLRKQGYGGCTMANHPSPLYAPFSMCNIVDNINSGDFTSLIAAANTLFTETADDNRPQVAALAALDFSKINIITISYSTNDFGLSVPIGTNTDTTGATFKGAINKVITTLANKYPHVRIMFASPTFRSRISVGDGLNSDDNPNSIGKYIREYRDAIKELCDLHHIEFFDLQSKSGINKQTALTYLSDGLHPNNTGSLLLARKWAAFLNSNF